MKNFTTIIMLVISIATVSAQKNTIVNATLKGLKSGIWIHCLSIDGQKNDSVQSVQNGFHFKLYIPEGEGNVFLIKLGNDSKVNKIVMYLEKGAVTINGKGPDFKDIKISGTPDPKDMIDYTNFTENDSRFKDVVVLQKKVDDLQKKVGAFKTKIDSEQLAILGPQLGPLKSKITAAYKEWVNKHTNSPVSAFILRYILINDLSNSEIEIEMNKLSTAAKNNAMGKFLLNSIEEDKLTRVGKMAPDFILNDPQGKPISSKDFRGKYVLIDFWASWCGYCRIENPYLVKAFNQYKNKNFTILSVSFDDKKEKWLKAIEKDGLEWSQVSDLKGYNKNPLGKLFNLSTIPQNFLLDKEGKIIAKDLRGEALSKKLAELLD